jgi:DNA helicase-4
MGVVGLIVAVALIWLALRWSAEFGRRKGEELAAKVAAEAAVRAAEEARARAAAERAEAEARAAAERLRLERQGAASKAGLIIARAAALEAAPRGDYFAASVLARFEAEQGAALQERLTVRERSLLDAATGAALARAEALLSDREGARNRYNEAFVPKRMAEMQGWFDARATKLTDEQRRAVVTDEDATLVIAAAGSGKTATIVAKAEYLVKRGLATPSQICLLAYNKRASEEMAERLKAVGMEGATTNTFHALGNAVHGQSKGQKPALSPLVEKGELPRFLNRLFAKMLQDELYRSNLVRWIVEKRVTLSMLDAAPTPHARLQMERSLDLRSLTGQRMRSQAEVKLADWMTLNGIRWEYEVEYPHSHNDPMRRVYKPDFYLPEAKVWLELWALDLKGNCAPTIDAAKYREGMEWKRAHHRKHQTELVEVFQDHVWNNGLESHLRLQFERLKIRVAPLSAAAIAALMAENRESGASRLTQLLGSFLTLHRGGLWTKEELGSKARDERDRAFLALYLPVVDGYEAELKRRNEIDFDEMLGGAVNLLSRVSTHRFKYVLVDEFQDTSRSRMEVIKQLRAVSPGARLCLVGDDWQSINRFAGSDLGLFTQAEKHLGMTARVALGTTFRLVPDVTEISSRFVMQNPSQIRKEVRTPKGALREPGIVLHGYEGDDQFKGLREVLELLVSRKSAGSRVLVLSRYKAPIEHLAMKELVEEFGERGLRLDPTTIHRSKGLEADHVVVMGLSSRSPSFPSATEDDPVLQLVSAAPDGFLSSEERRLMYVALTRSKGRVYLLHSTSEPSPFVEELLDREKGKLEVLGRVSDRLLCPRCQGRTILRREGDGWVIWGCMHFPMCDGRLAACEGCNEGAMVAVDRQVMECNGCKTRVQRCPRCEAGHLKLRTNSRDKSKFWACSEGRPNNEGCRYTRNG